MMEFSHFLVFILRNLHVMVRNVGTLNPGRSRGAAFTICRLDAMLKTGFCELCEVYRQTSKQPIGLASASLQCPRRHSLKTKASRLLSLLCSPVPWIPHTMNQHCETANLSCTINKDHYTIKNVSCCITKGQWSTQVWPISSSFTEPFAWELLSYLYFS